MLLFKVLLPLLSSSLFLDGGSATPLYTFEKKSAIDPYQPYLVSCPSNAIVRKGPSLNSQESAYVRKRKVQADAGLVSWLHRFGFNDTQLQSLRLPAVGLALGGGGPKASLLAAGILQALDGRDSSAGTAGVLQALTYLSGLSGGSLTLAGVVGNNLETISALRTTLWDSTFLHLLQTPIEHLVPIVADVLAKQASGSPATLLDVYARGLGYDVIGGSDGASGVTLSGVSSMRSFLDWKMPYPIIQSSAVNFEAGQCAAEPKTPLFEFSPYEFGSWDTGVASFVPMKVLGTTFVNGAPIVKGVCREGFDNLGWAIGTSANILANPNTTSCPFQAGGNNMSSPWLTPAAVKTLQDLNIGMNFYGIVPNPFKGVASANKVAAEDKLYLLDGGNTGLTIPYWSFLQPARSVDVIIAADVDSDGSGNITSGASLHNTLAMAQAYGISRMPNVPTVAQVQAQNLTSHPRFFGCGTNDTATLVWLPDTYATQFTGSELGFPKEGIDFLVSAGQSQATLQGEAKQEWPMCLACGIMAKTQATLPDGCAGCFEKYCWRG